MRVAATARLTPDHPTSMPKRIYTYADVTADAANNKLDSRPKGGTWPNLSKGPALTIFLSTKRPLGDLRPNGLATVALVMGSLVGTEVDAPTYRGPTKLLWGVTNNLLRAQKIALGRK